MAEPQDRSPSLGGAAKVIEAIIRPTIAIITTFLPLLITSTRKLYGVYKALPKNMAKCLIGLIFCFFGGLYPALFAALQAAKVGGWSKLTRALKDLTDEALIVIEQSKKDDAKDDDGDGKQDVKQISEKELLMRKVNLVLTKCNPEKIDSAIASLYTIWLSVVATLKIKFARTIALAVTIGDFLSMPAERFVGPVVRLVTPKEYHKWIPVVLGWICKSIAMSIAWSIQEVMSAAASAAQGGLIVGRSFVEMCNVRGMTLGGRIPANHEETMVDEVVGYTLAALGFYFQFKMGFDMPFPFNVVLFPFEMAEQYIRWAITE